MDIPSSTPANFPTPATGTVGYFFNIDDQGRLYYMTDARLYYPASQGMSDLVAGYVAETWIKNASCAMASGMITVSEYNSIINSGILVTSSSTDDGAGNRTSTLSVSSKTNIESISAEDTLVIDENTSLQIVSSVVPASSPQGRIYVSSDPSLVSVNGTGLMTAIGAAGNSCNITIFSMVNPLIYKNIVVTVI